MSSTLNELVTAIAAETDLPLVFHVENQPIRPDYHVTEVKTAQVQGLDCGRAESSWNELVVQLLDGPENADDAASHMQARTFVGLIQTSVGRLAPAGDADLIFEFAASGEAARRLSVTSVEQGDATWHVHLGPHVVACKPALRSGKGSGCCGSTPTTQQCCDKPDDSSTAHEPACCAA